MRISYDDDCSASESAFWRANLNRCLLGKKGQKALCELREALLALPAKRLITESLARDGEVCAIGALLASRSQQEERAALLRQLEDISDDEEDSAEYAASQGIPKMMAWAVVEENDGGYFNFGASMTPEERYERMLRWVDARLAGKPIS